jgi:hypothetical protein
MKFHRKLVLIGFTVYFLFNLGWDIWLYFLPTRTTLWNYLYNASYGALFLGGGIILALYGLIFSLKSNLGKMLLCFGLGLLSFGIGNMIWIYYNLILKVEIPFPSWADAAYLMLYPLMFLGCVYLLRIYQSLITKKLLRDSIIISIISFLIIFGFFARPDISEHTTLIQKIINVYYPFGDVVTLSLALIALRIGGGKMHPSIYIFSFGLLLQTAADLLFAYRNAEEIYWNGDISDLLFTCSAYFISIGLFETIHSLTQVSSKIPQQIAPALTQTQPLPNATPNLALQNVATQSPTEIPKM